MIQMLPELHPGAVESLGCGRWETCRDGPLYLRNPLKRKRGPVYFHSLDRFDFGLAVKQASDQEAILIPVLTDKS